MHQSILDYKLLIKDLSTKLSFEYFELDLIISPGGFNIFYALGIIDLLKELENQKKLKVHRIMGASAGAFAGLFYFSNLSSDIFKNHYNDLKSHFDKYKNVNLLFDYIDKYITDKNILNQINNKLHICYHKSSQESKFPTYEINSMFENLDELKTILKGSSTVPFFTTSTPLYKKNDVKYFDGMYTTTFEIHEPNRKTLHINLHSIFDLFSAIVPYKSSCDSQYFEGISDLYHFLQNQKDQNDNHHCLKLTNNKTDPYPTLTFSAILYRFILYSILVIYINFIEILYVFIEKMKNLIKKNKIETKEFEKVYRHYYETNENMILQLCMNFFNGLLLS
jgi:hypothetical protein